MSTVSPVNKTPIKAVPEDQSFDIPDTPTSLASSYNKDVIYNPPDSNTNNMNEQITQTVSKRIQYNALHDSIESLSSHPHNSSIIGDFRDIKTMIEDENNGKNKEAGSAATDEAHSGDMIQKWLQDRKRWELVQQTYEQKVAELQKMLQSKSAQFEQKMAEMLEKESKYKKEMKSLHHQIQNTHNNKDSDDDQQRNQLEQEHRKLRQNNLELNAKYQAAQHKLSENAEMLQRFETENKRLRETNHSLSQQLAASNGSHESENKSKIKQLTDQLDEAKHENERLKQLELTSQNMVERLLKRLEQQIHSAEATQQQLNLKQKQHDEEILKLEQINSKLQKNLVQMHGSGGQHKISMLSPCSSDSSIFTLSTVMTKDNRDYQQYVDHAATVRDQKTNRKETQQLQLDLEAMKKENESLKEIVRSFEQMLNMSPCGKSKPTADRHQEWMKRTKQMAKQSVFVEKLKNEIVQKDAKIRALERLETQRKEAVNELELTVNQQRNSISLLEKTNSDISLELIEQRSLRQRLEKDIEDLQFENKQLRNKVIAFKNFASQTRLEVAHDENSDKSPNQQQSFPEEDVFERVEQVSMGRPSDANTIHLRNNNNNSNAANNSGNNDKLLLDGLRNLIDQYASHSQQYGNDQKPSSPPRLPQSAPSTADRQRRNEKIPKRVIQSAKTRKAAKPKTLSRTKMVEKGDMVHRGQSLWKSGSRKAPKNRHRIPCMTPMTYLHDQQNEKTTSKKVKSSRNHTKRKKRTVVDIPDNRIKVIRISKPKKSSPCNTVDAKTMSKHTKRRKCAQSASKRAALHPCIRHKHWV